MEHYYVFGDERYAISVKKNEEGYVVEARGKTYHVKYREVKPGFLQLQVDEKMHKCCVAREKEFRHVFFDGGVFRLRRVDRLAAGGAFARVSGDITSPISGRIVKVNVTEGQAVETDAVLVVIDAMKMEYLVKAPYAGTITKVHRKEGEQVDIGARLVDVKKAGE